MKFLSEDCRNLKPEGQKVGCYYITKKNTIARFTFGNPDSSTFENIDEAFKAMREFLDKRKDADSLYVQLLNNHF